MSWTTYTVYNFADDLHWPELGILLESIDYHEAARKASFLGSMCEDSLMAAIHFERRFDALMKYVINTFDLGLAVSVPLPIVTGIFVLLWFQSRLT